MIPFLIDTVLFILLRVKIPASICRVRTKHKEIVRFIFRVNLFCDQSESCIIELETYTFESIEKKKNLKHAKGNLKVEKRQLETPGAYGTILIPFHQYLKLEASHTGIVGPFD